jgi:hypothetical protein
MLEFKVDPIFSIGGEAVFMVTPYWVSEGSYSFLWAFRSFSVTLELILYWLDGFNTYLFLGKYFGLGLFS